MTFNFFHDVTGEIRLHLDNFVSLLLESFFSNFFLSFSISVLVVQTRSLMNWSKPTPHIKTMMDDFENMSEFSPFTWQPVYADGSSGEIIDFNTTAIEQQSQFSTSRGMLETIVEETSDDEENGLYSGQWTTGSDSFSSGSSETGSVVRVDAVGGKLLLNSGELWFSNKFFYYWAQLHGISLSSTMEHTSYNKKPRKPNQS